MIDYEISLITDALDEAVKKLQLAKAGKSSQQIERAEEQICMETRTLFSKYVDIVLWSGELKSSTYRAVRKVIEAGCDAVSWRNTDTADSVKQRLGEFDRFSEGHLKRKHLLHS